MNKNLLILSAAGFLVLSACSHQSVKRTDLANTANPAEEIQKMDQRLAGARSQDTDLLSPYYFKKSEKAFKEAQDDFQSKQANKEILEDISYSQAYLNKAEEVAAISRKDLTPVLESRQGALQAQAHTYFPKELRVLENDLRDLSKEYEDNKIEPASAKEISKLQQDFNELQADSMKAAQLGHAASLIKNAKKDGAKKYVPHVLEQAEAAYSNAETVIDTDRNNTTKVQASVQSANEQAERVAALTTVARDARNRSPEEVALAIENKNKELAAQGVALQTQQSRNVQVQSALEETHSNLMQSKEQLATTQANVNELKQKEEFQQALEESRQSFGKNEAEAYQQGGSLLIRLKSLNFASNRSELPSSSYETLKKVKGIVAKLGPSKVVIEGHTDSVGTAEVNKKLSEARAETVKSFLVSENVVQNAAVETEGIGADKPITTNKTSAGRAQNRRVDIIITPEASVQ